MLFKLRFLTLLFWATSANAAQICPPGYRDKLQDFESETEYYVTFQGKTYQCLERKGSKNYTVEHVCSDRITVYQGGDYLKLVSKEGLDFTFSREGSLNTTRTKDCSSGSFCIERSQHTRQTKNEHANFSIPITMVNYEKTLCEKYSF